MVKGLFLSLIVATGCFAQASPDWYSRPQFFSYGAYSRQEQASGIPFTGQAIGWLGYNPDFAVPARREVGIFHSQGGMYFGIISMSNRFEKLPRPEWDEFRMRTVSGGYTDEVDHLGLNYTYTISARTFREDTIAAAMRFIDLGADGMVIDDIGWQIGRIVGSTGNNAGSFDGITMAAFRAYLLAKYEPQAFQEQFGAALDNFDFGAYIRSQGTQATWNAQPLTGLALDFYVFRREESRNFLREIATQTKTYARERYGREIWMSANANNDPASFFYRDVMDMNTSELSYLQGRDHPFMALDIKAAKGWKEPMIVIPLALVKEWGATRPLSKPTVNLERLILADIYASGGIGGAQMQLNQGYESAQAVDTEVVARYARFILQNPQLMTQLTIPKRLGLLQGASSMLGNIVATPGQANARDGRDAYTGTARLLIDGGFSYESLFLPDTTYSDLPSPTPQQLARFQTLIAPSLFALDDTQVAGLLGFAEQGGTLIILGDFGTNESDHSLAARSELRGLLTTPGEMRFGAGRIVYNPTAFGVQYQRPDAASQRTARETFHAFLRAYTQPEVEVAGPAALFREPGVTPYYYTDRTGTLLVHLVNYDYDDETDQFQGKKDLTVTVQVGGQTIEEVILRTPDSPQAQPLVFTQNGETVTTAVPELEAWAVLSLQANAAPPLITATAPAPEIEVKAGSTLAFNLDASDTDGNPLSCTWTVNGETISNFFGPDFSLKVPASARTSYSVMATVTDGTRTTQYSWLVRIQPSRKARILFDETHQEINSINLEVANQISPGHPEWVSYAMLAEILGREYEVGRLAASNRLTSPVLRDVDVVVLAGARSALTPAELTAMQEFVRSGGGVLYLLNANPSMAPAAESFLGPLGIRLDAGLLKTSTKPTTNSCLDCFFLTRLENHPAIAVDAAFGVNWAGSLILSADAKPLAWTSELEWRSVLNLSTPQPGEPFGPFVVVAGAELGKGRVLATSARTFTDDFLRGLPYDGNIALFRSALAWLAEPLLTERPELVVAAAGTTTP
ncbi:hypothetical protein [Paludibaculum fermentans]|uniref:hypothetical protein n=1 Tax=Paludibaculum fermentans TaxID=1473598 RepID=UPI003EB98BDC